jgi:hypothetical protein
MKRLALFTIVGLGFGLGLAAGCHSQKAAPAAPANSQATAPTTTTTVSDKDAAYQACLKNGPQGAMGSTDWGSVPQEEKENQCSAEGADADMPVESEH